MRTLEIFFGAVWIALGLYWLIAAVIARSARVWSAQSVAFRLAAIALVLIATHTPLNGNTGTVRSTWLHATGVVIFLFGVGLAAWARIFLGNNWGMPMTEKVDPELITTGPYRYIRHPIYSGLLVAVIGTALALNLYGLLVAVFAGVYFVYSATVEERTMASHFPAVYPNYRRSTKMLIPLVL